MAMSTRAPSSPVEQGSIAVLRQPLASAISVKGTGLMDEVVMTIDFERPSGLLLTRLVVSGTYHEFLS